MHILGIESSCDETSVAIISNGELRANLISSQDFHKKYGGVVPELSSRAHIQILIPLLRDALKQSNLTLEKLDIISATAGPGLIGALLVGLTFGKGLSYSLKKPFVPVNHIEGHIYSGFLMEEKPEFPFLSLIVSGGHTLLLLVKSDAKIIHLGSTVDDAVGEAFDKVAKMLGLGYPGGPQIQKWASKGNSDKIVFPVAELKNPYDFSFSGLKTAVLRYVQKNFDDVKSISENDKADIAAGFQKAAVKALTNNVKKALKNFEVKSLSVAGGVAANSHLREEFNSLAKKINKKIVIPDLIYCGDNAAMIAYRGLKVFESGKKFTLDYKPYPGLPPEIFQYI